jgi:putative phosphoribosyl transferase
MNLNYQKEVSIPVQDIRLKGELSIPEDVKAIIIFSHGSGSSRLSKRNQMVAKHLQEKGFGTLLFDLLTPKEDRDYQNRFDINTLAERLEAATLWLEKIPAAKDICICYFGASTGAASALKAAARLPQVCAVVSRGGRPDLVMEDLPFVQVPTLFIVGSLDHHVLELNQKAFQKLNCKKKFEVIDGATHLFDEPGKLEVVADLAVEWFKNYIPIAHES